VKNTTGKKCNKSRKTRWVAFVHALEDGKEAVHVVIWASDKVTSSKGLPIVILDAQYV
jgi:hypothetical protein